MIYVRIFKYDGWLNAEDLGYIFEKHKGEVTYQIFRNELHSRWGPPPISIRTTTLPDVKELGEHFYVYEIRDGIIHQPK